MAGDQQTIPKLSKITVTFLNVCLLRHTLTTPAGVFLFGLFMCSAEPPCKGPVVAVSHSFGPRYMRFVFDVAKSAILTRI